MVLTPIQEFYASKNILITGVSGFVGKVLFEKILRCCPNFNKIYVLIRQKDELDVFERRERLFSSLVHNFGGKFAHKIVVVPGDLVQPKLGLSDDSYRMLVDEIDIIFHLGSINRYDVTLYMATRTNVGGSREILNLARQMKRLKSVVCLSDVYSNFKRSEIDEKFYNPDVRADNLEQMVHSVPTDICLEVTPYMTEFWPNPCTFSKSVAENCIEQYGNGLPVCLVRSSLITFTSQEPEPGWLDNFEGFNAYPYELLRGSIRVVYGDLDSKANLVPADFVANILISAAWHQATNIKSSEIKIYNYISQERNAIDCETFWDLAISTVRKMPSKQSKFYYFQTVASNYWLFYIYSFFLHLVPAMIGDFVLLLTGNKTEYVNFYRKLNNNLLASGHFFNSKWKFTDDNVYDLFEKLTPMDKTLFNFNIRTIDWSKYLENGFKSVRFNLLKENSITVSKNIKRLQKLKILYFIILFVFYTIATWIFYNFATLFLTKIVR